MPTTMKNEEFRKRTFRLLEAFVYDYLKKSGCTETAQAYYNEANLSNWPPSWLSNPSESSSFSSADNITKNAGFTYVQINEPSRNFNSGKNSYNVEIKTESEEDLPEHYPNGKVGINYGSYDDLMIGDASETTAMTAVSELPDLPLPLKDGFLKEFWDVLWINYKDMFESLTKVKLDD
jgi:hypothetical protein